MLCKADATIRDHANIKDWKNYRICSQTGTVAEVNSWNDNAEMKDMHAAYILLGFSEVRTRAHVAISISEALMSL